MENQDKYIEFVPGNWLYNAGVVGFLTILSTQEDNITDILKKGITKTIIEKLFNKKVNVQFTSMINEKIPYWHWEYLKLTYKKYYGNIDNIVNTVFYAASTTTNSKYKSQLKKKLLEKDKNKGYKKHNFIINNQEVDFSDAYKEVDRIWTETFKKKPTLAIEDAINLTLAYLKNFENAIIFLRAIAFLFSTGCFYQNYYNPGWYDNADKFIEYFKITKIFKTKNIDKRILVEKCDLCGLTNLETKKIDLMMFANLFPNYGNFPNSFWNMNPAQTQNICSLCEFFLLHRHLGFTKTMDNTEIFINAPSFEVIYNLNQILKDTFSSDSLDKKDLLAITIIEAVIKRNLLIGKWAGMNIEIVSQKNGIIDFFSLPYSVVELLGNRKIALLLKEIGEFSILNLVLDEKFKELIEIAYRILKISMKEDENKGDEKYLNDILYLTKNKYNSSAQRLVANKIMKLYALIEEQLKNE
jgi:hypothetical protein